MASLDRASGMKVAEAIEKRINLIAKDLYNNAPDNRTAFGVVLDSKDGLFTIKINNKTYPKVQALRNVGGIKKGEKVFCIIPNNNFSDITIIGVADETLNSGFVNLIGNQNIEGEKNFTGKLLLNGDELFPVGSIIIRKNYQASPASIYGGTWKLLDEGFALWTTTTDGQGGGKIDAGLPNISGYFTGPLNGTNGGTGVHTGPFYLYSVDSDSNTWGGNSGWNNASTEGFDASRANSIYGKSTTVQPPAIKVYAWERIE